MAFPAVIRAFVCLVTPLAEAHVQRLHFVRHRHLLDFTVTKRAYLGYVLDRHPVIVENKALQMLFMREMDEIRHVVNLVPLRRFMLFPIFRQFLDSRLVSRDYAVTTHAFAGRRNPGHLAAPCIGMTIHTIDFVYIGVDVVWKLDGLGNILPVVSPHRWYGIGHLGLRRGHQQQKENPNDQTEEFWLAKAATPMTRFHGQPVIE